MARARASKRLAHGLRALRLFARLAPVDPAGFASASKLEPGEADALLGVFEASGYIRRVSGSDLLVLSAKGMELPLPCNGCALNGSPPGTQH